MNESRADLVALIVMTVISIAMILFGDWRFGTSVLIASVVVFFFAKRRRKRFDRW
jgi:cbb3-type cytochrome oxidase subunit 3